MHNLIRVLVVDDHEVWRRFTSNTFQQQPNLRVLGEASDGPQAIQLAQELQPDLILLDIGLPRINGIEAARQIRGLCKSAKILFMTENHSADIAEAALSTGACGYVVKSDAGRELLPAVKAVLEGRRYISDRVAGRHSSQTHDLNQTVAPFRAEKKTRHEVEFYNDDADFVNGFARFVEMALKADDAVIVVATESHHARLGQRLTASGLKLSTEIRKGRYIPLEVTSVLSRFMVNDSPDPVLFKKLAINLIAEAGGRIGGRSRRVSVCGEGVNTLVAAGNVEAAITLERLWNEVAQPFEIRILCAYFKSAFLKEGDTLTIERICAEHSAHGRELENDHSEVL